ncbi:MAG: hypothetical protein C0597_15625 [Marinilabiliales bacterium]|nr:MAG: hypothetical protein C0597_15625 [Marinilabiliales bacterium]
MLNFRFHELFINLLLYLPDIYFLSMKRYIVNLTILFILLLAVECIAQEKPNVYFNVGYVTNFKKNPESEKVDQGGSVRLGFLGQKRFGAYIGYLWFQEYNLDYVEYDDKGRVFIAGVAFCFLKRKNFKTFINMGLGYEKYLSVYSTRTETETSFKPDLGILFNINKFNIYTGWQPSDPSHINIGIGITL